MLPLNHTTRMILSNFIITSEEPTERIKMIENEAFNPTLMPIILVALKQQSTYTQLDRLMSTSHS